MPLNANQAYYQVKFLQGALKYYGISFDYVGIWNEKSWTIDYVKLLRKELDVNGLDFVKIVIGDGTVTNNFSLNIFRMAKFWRYGRYVK